MKALTRRHVLRGAGVALALPWLESLAPRRARGQSAARPLRFVPIYFPLGTARYWTPTGVGSGDSWQLSPILEPLGPVKAHVTVLGHVNQSVYAGVPYPGNGILTGSYLTSARCRLPNPSTDPTLQNGISLDQRLAQALGLRSLQAGLSTLNSYCDGAPCAYSRSISWSDAATPLYKTVNPQTLFDQIVSGRPASDPAAPARAASRKSVLDFVLGNAKGLEAQLGRGDRARVDQFLTSVRDLETRAAAVAATPAFCANPARPTLSADVGAVPPDYDRGVHADVTIDLIVMALACDAARVVSFMLDDARSYWPYDFLTQRHFTASGSTPGTTKLPANGTLVGWANAGDTNDGWATVDWWFVSKLAALCQKMAAVPDGDGSSLLDNSVVWFGSPQQNENGILNLPLLYAGSGGGALKTDAAFDFADGPERLSNVYLTFLRHVFGLPDASFGDSTGTIDQLLA
jgi:hypothetical protein